ncbi:uncharacterized protein LOC119834908 [Zerene cesonia]|uniref:uncharacterized protein LOC119834908 n=1 Tax=Zerene cesonia TaxID=33412 RepID=UPI0018E59273|nr:uncharacterized protein LOC119834908 [Zerene cesonia]
MKNNIFCIIYFVIGCVYCTRFDQSQSGNLNVQVDLKDLQIIALLKGGKEEYVDYDYAYDYNEMTIKPQNRTTPRPLNGTTLAESDAGTSSKATITPVYNEQTEFSTKVPITDLSNGPTDVTVIDYSTTEKYNVQVSTEKLIPVNKNETLTLNTTTNSTKCKKGFVLNYKGDCELKLQSSGNALLKLVKLSQKLKLRRENKDED